MLIVKWHAYNNMYMPTLIDLVTGSSKYTLIYTLHSSTNTTASESI